MEDYVHVESWKMIVLLANSVFTYVVGAGALYALARLTFGAMQ